MKKKKLIAAIVLSSLFLLPAKSARADQIVNTDITSGSVVENYTGNAYGGAVLNESGNSMTITDSTLQNNTSTTSGGAVYNQGTLTITDGTATSHSTFSGNTSHAGGAIYSAEGSTLKIGDHTSFENNHTFTTDSSTGAIGDAGGAIYVDRATLDIGDNVTFSGNTAPSDVYNYPDGGQAKGAAGAAYIYNSTVTVGDNLTVDNNKSEFASGGLYIWNNDGKTATIGNDAEFKNNSSDAAYGGAIGNFDGTLQIGTGALFQGNSADDNGGAVANMNFSTEDGANLTVGSGAQFIGNSSSASGGAIYNESTITLNGAIFSGNTAAEGGGAIYNEIDSVANLNNVIVSQGPGNAANDIYNAGTIATGGNNSFASNITNTGTINTDGTNNFSGNINNTGEINLSGINTISGAITGQGGKVTNNGTLNIGEGFSITNEFINTATIKGGDLVVQNGTNTGDITPDSFTVAADSTYNNGDITVSPSDSGTITTGSFTNNGTFINNDGSSVITDAIVNNGSFTNNGTLSKNTTSLNSLSITNNTNATFENNSSITVDNLVNNGSISGDTGSMTIAGGENNNSIYQGTVAITGDFENNDVLTALDTFSNSANITGEDGTLYIFNDSGTSSNSGTISQANVAIDGTAFSNTGTITSTEIFSNTSVITGQNGVLNITDVDNNSSNEGTIEQAEVNISGDSFENTGSITATNTFTNSATITGENGKLYINNAANNSSNSGNISQAIVEIAGTEFSNTGTISATNTFTNSANITGNGNLNIQAGSNSGQISQNNVTVGGNFENTSSITANNLTNTGTISGDTGTLNVTNGSSSGSITQNSMTVNGQFDITAGNVEVETLTNNANATLTNDGSLIINDELTNDGTILNRGNYTANYSSVLTNDGTFINSGEKAVMSTQEVINNNIFKVTDNASISLTNMVNNGTFEISDGSTVGITAQQNDLGGIINVERGYNTLSLEGNAANIVGTMNVGNTNNENTYLVFDSGNVTEGAALNIEKGAIASFIDNTQVNLNENDTIKGDIILSDGASIDFNNFSHTTGEISTQEGSDMPFYTQLGGVLNLKNNSTLAMQNLSTIQGGDINIDSGSKLIALTEDYGGIYNLNNLNTSGMLAVMNSDIDEYNIQNLNIGANTVGDVRNQADFTIDVYGRSNAEYEHGTDQFIGENLTGNGTVNISDWNLGGDIFGWDAPIDRDIALDNVFKYNSIAPTINLTATKKEVFTPIGWYQLNNHGGITGNYTLNLTRFNPQVYRGQVTTLAQWMNQLAIDDMLFNHSMLLPSFKDDDGGVAYSGVMANRYSSTMPQFAPYQYSRKDGGLWYKMYGTFETMQMSQGLSNVGNNAYGALIGADFGLKELRNGWKFMPTAYIGYNGAHQYFAGMGAYQNGGQAGFLGTWYKNNFIIGGLIYGGVYDNSMDIAGHTDSTFNYFAGAATKVAYNWRFHRDWVLQPNLFLAYNFFGQQNWHSAFGQMGMMSGILNGINLAPGLNLIWEKETFSIYATLQYMYNLNGAVGGRAGNVNLPHLDMDRGYIQYGIGFTKRFTDRFSGYFQTVFRNVGRTGVGFQLGFNFLLGK